MTKGKRTLTDSIRAVLRDSDGPMSVSDVCQALPDTAKRITVTALLSQRRTAGEFAVQIIDGKPAYSTNPDYVPARRKQSGSAAASDASTTPSAPTDDPPEPVYDAPAVSQPAITGRFGWADRMSAIAQDLDDATTDAINADLGKDVLRQLVAARSAISNALVSTLRS